jgi:hypothetical protein
MPSDRFDYDVQLPRLEIAVATTATPFRLTCIPGPESRVGVVDVLVVAAVTTLNR